MKKILKQITTILLGLMIPSSLFALDFGPDDFGNENTKKERKDFLGGNLGLDLYSKISDGYTNIQLKIYENELKGGLPDGKIGEKLAEELEKATSLDCINIDKNINLGTFNNIRYGSILDVHKIIKDECKGSDGSISTDIIYNIINTTRKIHNEIKQITKDKSKNTYYISKVGLYSDGNTDNSPFDLIKDIKDIDKVIFTQDIPYNGINKDNNDNVVNDFLDGKDKNQELNNTFSKINKNSNSGLNNKESDLLNNILNSNNSSCDINNSGLSDDFLNNIGINTSNDCSKVGLKISSSCCNGLIDKKVNSKDFCIKNDGSSVQCTYKKSEQEGYYHINNKGEIGELILKEKCSQYDNNDLTNLGGSSGVEEDKWPCDNFFCIIIEFKMYTHNLLGGGGKTKSIESILQRSNKHVNKHVNTSLVQGKMTINNWEIGLRDLDLPSIFNMGMHIEWRPAPILNLGANKKENKEEKNYIKNKILEEYKELKLDGFRINDLDIFKNKEYEQASLLNSIELSQKYGKDRLNKIEELYNSLKESDRLNELKNISKVDSESMEDFYKDFLELSRLIDNLEGSYTKKLLNTIKSIHTGIPIGKQ